MDFKNNKLFMDVIKEDNIFAIKSDLEGYIEEYKGDKVKCDEIVEFAINNSSFDWENDDGIFLGNKKATISEEYFYEKGRLVQNFTKERYLKVIDLYNKYIQEKIAKTYSNNKINLDEQRTSKKKKTEFENGSRGEDSNIQDYITDSSNNNIDNDNLSLDKIDFFSRVKNKISYYYDKIKIEGKN